MGFFKVKWLLQKRAEGQFQEFLQRTKKGWRTELLVGESEPFSVAFNVQKMQLTVKCHYGCWNEFGYGFHG